MDILNHLKVSDLIQTSGQPKAEEFVLIRESGTETVINLIMPDNDAAIENEGKLVTENGMNYVHIPVVWQSPEVEQLALFKSIMEHHKNKSIWVHCALNWRVASFVYLYRVTCLGVPEDEAKEALGKVWQPNEVWSKFIADNV